MSGKERKEIKKTERYWKDTYIYETPLSDAIERINSVGKELVDEHGEGALFVHVCDSDLSVELVVTSSRPETDKEYLRRVERSKKATELRHKREQEKRDKEIATLMALSSKYKGVLEWAHRTVKTP